jgi:hypothetical protein
MDAVDWIQGVERHSMRAAEDCAPMDARGQGNTQDREAGTTPDDNNVACT